MTQRRPCGRPQAEPAVARRNDANPTCVTLRPGTGHATVDLAGEVDVCTAPQLSPVIHGLLAQGRNRITINLDGVTFMDASALSALVMAHRDVSRSHGKLDVTDNPVFARLQQMTGLVGLFDA
jgi:anti-sigma B factor antagonist